MNTMIQTDPETTDITSELQEVRGLVRQVIKSIGKPQRKIDADLTDPSRAVAMLEKLETVKQLESEIIAVFARIGLPEIPLNVLLRTFEYAEPDAWQGTFCGFLAASRAGLDSLDSQTKETIEFDRAVDERRRALWEFEDQCRKVERLEQELEEMDGKDANEG